MDEERKAREELRERIMAQRREIISKIEAERSTKVITLIHRREPWEEDEDSITIEDSEFVLMEVHRTPKDRPIDIILHTPGGLVLSAEMIATALKQHPAPVTAIVPFYAMSGGTMIALAADEILMEEFSVLGPLDPQINGIAAGSLLELLTRKPIETISDEIILLADVAEKALKEVKAYIQWFLEGKEMSHKQREKVAEFLTGGYIAHDHPLNFETLRGLQLPIHQGVPELVFELFTTCEFGVCKRPCVAHYGVAPRP
jgi:ClpP class serine protease